MVNFVISLSPPCTLPLPAWPILTSLHTLPASSTADTSAPTRRRLGHRCGCFRSTAPATVEDIYPHPTRQHNLSPPPAGVPERSPMYVSSGLDPGALGPGRVRFLRSPLRHISSTTFPCLHGGGGGSAGPRTRRSHPPRAGGAHATRYTHYGLRGGGLWGGMAGHVMRSPQGELGTSLFVACELDSDIVGTVGWSIHIFFVITGYSMHPHVAPRCWAGDFNERRTSSSVSGTFPQLPLPSCSFQGLASAPVRTIVTCGFAQGPGPWRSSMV